MSSLDGRDRDSAGRPTNSRPRDGLGRPLPHGAVGVPRIPDDVRLPADESLARAQELLDSGSPFHAHEILEGTWKIAPESERELWRGLAQLAVGITHAHRGNNAGAVSLLTQARDRLESFAIGTPHSIDASGLVAWSDRALTSLRSDDRFVPDSPHLTVS